MATNVTNIRFNRNSGLRLAKAGACVFGLFALAYLAGALVEHRFRLETLNLASEAMEESRTVSAQATGGLAAVAAQVDHTCELYFGTPRGRNEA